MTKENIVTLTASPSEGTEAKRNKKTQLLSALLSASALGVFLEGCGPTPSGPTRDGVTGDGSESDPHLATAKADILDGPWVSYASSTAAVTINLDSYATRAESGGVPKASGGWAEGDKFGLDVLNVIGSDHDDTFFGGDGVFHDNNSFEGGGATICWRGEKEQTPIYSTRATARTESSTLMGQIRSSSSKGQTIAILGQTTTFPMSTESSRLR